MILDWKAVNHINFDVGIQLFQLAQRSLRSRILSDVAFSDVEVRAHVLYSARRRVVNVNWGWASKDKVLCSFDTETSHTDDQSLKLNKFAHSLEAKCSDLAWVKIRVNLDSFLLLHQVDFWLIILSGSRDECYNDRLIN